MSKFQFKKATKYEAKLRLALIGLSGSGKTYSALEIARHLLAKLLATGDRPPKIRLIDSERKSAQKYADIFDFETFPLESFEPATYVEALEAAQKEDGGCDLIIVDSLSHAWSGKGGALEQVDLVGKRKGSKNSFDAWREVTPMHNRLVDTLLACKTHLIATMRTKTHYDVEVVDKGGGRTSATPKKIGMQPIQRDGLEYEFDIIGDMDIDNNLIVGKTRCSAVAGQVYNKPGKEFAEIVATWLGGVAPPAEEEKKPAPEEHPQLGRINKPTIKSLFELLGTPEAARLAAAEKYRSDDKLLEVVKRRLVEHFGTDNVSEIEEKKKAAAAPPATAEPAAAAPTAESLPATAPPAESADTSAPSTTPQGDAR